MKRRKMVRNSSISVEEAFEQFEDYNILRNLSPATIAYYKKKVQYFIEYIGGVGENISDINQKVVNGYILSMKKTDSISDVTINVRIRALRSFLNYCMKNGMLDHFEINTIKAPYPIKEPYTDSELEILLRKPNVSTCLFSEYRNWVIINFLLSTGCRLGTLVEIKIGDIDFKEGTVCFKHMKTRNQIVVPLSQTIINILKEYVRYREGTPDDYLFVSETNAKMTPNTVHSSIARYNKNRGIKKTSIHLFRHTFAMKYIQAGGDPFRLQKLLGHSDLAMTRKYVSLYSDDLKANYDRLNPLEQFMKQHQKLSK